PRNLAPPARRAFSKSVKQDVPAPPLEPQQMLTTRGPPSCATRAAERGGGVVRVWTWLTVTIRALSMTPSRLRDVVGVQVGLAGGSKRRGASTAGDFPGRARPGGLVLQRVQALSPPWAETIVHRGSG